MPADGCGGSAGSRMPVNDKRNRDDNIVLLMVWISDVQKVLRAFTGALSALFSEPCELRPIYRNSAKS